MIDLDFGPTCSLLCKDRGVMESTMRNLLLVLKSRNLQEDSIIRFDFVDPQVTFRDLSCWEIFSDCAVYYPKKIPETCLYVHVVCPYHHDLTKLVGHRPSGNEISVFIASSLVFLCK